LLSSAGTDQVILQTYLTAKSVKEAKASLWRNGLLLKPLSLVFPVLGAILFVYFREHPAHAALVRVPDEALPVFVVNVLPAGVRGLAIAALMSALLTSLEGGMAALSACVQVDYVQRWIGRLPERSAVRLGRALLLTWGLVIICAAFFVLRLGKSNNIIQILNIVMYPFAGVLLGVFLLGLLTRRANAPGTLIGAATGFLVTIGVPLAEYVLPRETLANFGELRRVSNFYFGALGTAATFLVGSAVSRLFAAPPPERLAGLTHRTPAAYAVSKE
jgi:Na+/proline symporter